VDVPVFGKMSTHAANDADLIPEAGLKLRWKVHGDTVLRWRARDPNFPAPAALIGRRRWYSLADIERFEQRALVRA
jgi:hypothetical protein